MAGEQIKDKISELKEIAIWWIENEGPFSELEKLKNILEGIKSEKTSKEQLKEIIKFLNEQTRNIPGGDIMKFHELTRYKNDFENLLANYEVEKKVIVDKTITDKNDVKSKNSKLQENQTNSEFIINWYDNFKAIKRYKTRLSKVLSNFDEKDADEKKLKELLEKTISSPNKENVWELQSFMMQNWEKVIISKDGNADSKFGQRTMANLEEIVWIESPKVVVSWTWKKAETKWDKIPANSATDGGMQASKKVDLHISDKPNIPEQKLVNPWEKIESYTISKNGRILLNWKDLSKNGYSIDATQLENLKKAQKWLWLLGEIHEIWTDAALKHNDSMIWWIFRSDVKRSITNQIADNEKLFNEIVNDFVINWTKTWWLNKTLIDKYFSVIVHNGNTSWIVSNFDKVQGIFNWNQTFDKKRKEIFTLMRSGYIDKWNSSKIASKLEADIIPKFTWLKNIFENPQLLNVIDNAEWLEKLGIPKDIAKDLSSKYGKIKADQEKRRKEIQEALKTAWKDNNTQQVDQYISLATQSASLELLKSSLVKYFVKYNTTDWHFINYKDPQAKDLVEQYSDIKKIWSWKISDENIDTAEDIWFTVAMSAISMWVWALAARWAMGLINAGLNTERWLKAVNYINSWTRTAKWLKNLWWAWTLALEWTAFYEGSNLTHNALYKDSLANLFDEAGNTKEIAKSIAFFGILRWISKISWSEKIKNMSDKIPAKMKLPANITKIAGEAGLLVWVSQWIEISFWEDFNPTWEEYIQALIMVWLVRWASKINFSKWKDGIKMETETKTQNTQKKYTWSKEAPIDTKAEPLVNWLKPGRKVTENISEEILDNSWNISKYAKSKFDSIFREEFKEWTSLKVWEKTYTKRKDGLFEIEWDSVLYKEKEILAKISDEDKVIFLQEKAKNWVYSLWEKTIKLKDWVFNFAWRYKVSDKEVLIKEWWNWRKLNDTESNKFFADNFEKLLKEMKWVDPTKIAEKTSKSFLSKFEWSKWADALKSIDKWAEQAFLVKYPYKAWRWATKTALNEMATPYNIYKNFKESNWFAEVAKTILFANKDIWVIKWVAKVWAYATIPTIWEMIRKTNNWEEMKLDWRDMIENYLEFMYLWIINWLIIESIQRKINSTEEKETK